VRSTSSSRTRPRSRGAPARHLRCDPTPREPREGPLASGDGEKPWAFHPRWPHRAADAGGPVRAPAPVHKGAQADRRRGLSPGREAARRGGSEGLKDDRPGHEGGQEAGDELPKRGGETWPRGRAAEGEGHEEEEGEPSTEEDRPGQGRQEKAQPAPQGGPERRESAPQADPGPPPEAQDLPRVGRAEGVVGKAMEVVGAPREPVHPAGQGVGKEAHPVTSSSPAEHPGGEDRPGAAPRAFGTATGVSQRTISLLSHMMATSSKLLARARRRSRCLRPVPARGLHGWDDCARSLTLGVGRSPPRRGPGRKAPPRDGGGSPSLGGEMPPVSRGRSAPVWRHPDAVAALLLRGVERPVGGEHERSG